MIDITIPSRRKSAVKVFEFKHPPATSMFAEAKRRDDIIRNLVKECALTEGEVATPWCDKERVKWGDFITVEKICDSYAKFGKNSDWPKDDNPLLITAYNPLTKNRFHCSTGYLVPLHADGTIPKDKKE